MDMDPRLLAGLQNADLKIPTQHHNLFRRFTMTGRSDVNRDNVPFIRFVDLWWLALCIGVQEGKRIQPNSWHTFVRAGEIYSSCRQIFLQLQLLAMNEDESADILADPVSLMGMANEYAAAGLEVIANETLGNEVPLLHMMEFVESRILDR